jgi:FKBP-type peptidyl-prolyl cis-trans isomerase FklB
MKSVYIAGALTVSLLVLSLFAQGENKAADSKVELKTAKDKSSYAIGLNIGKSFKTQGLDIDLKPLLKGIEDGLSGQKALLTNAEIRDTMMALQKEMMAKQADRKKIDDEKRKVDGEKNRKDGEAFLAENKNKPGVVALPSGLQYVVLKEGTGDKPQVTDKVKTHYRGTLVDGTEFDSSIGGEPAVFPLNRVIPGWTEVLQLMPVGSKWQIFLPSELAYGENGQGEAIGPNAALIFEIELLEIVK